MTTLPAYLTRRGESQTAFAARSGLTDSTLSRVLSGKISPSAEVVEKVRWATEGAVTADDLYGAWRRSLGRAAADLVEALADNKRTRAEAARVRPDLEAALAALTLVLSSVTKVARPRAKKSD
jgi:transcriptional regulator with XRE-family HTH domain